MPRYTVTTFDVCCSGAERLRNRDEFILLAYPDGRSGAGVLREQWIADLNTCDRGPDFDYAAARREIGRFCADLRRAWKGKRNPMDLGPRPDGEECVTAFLYVRDNKPSAAG